MEQQFQGPIPPPDILAGYDQIIPGAADRIFSMAESESAHRRRMEKAALDAEIKGLNAEANDTKRGQVFGLIIGVVAILAGAYTATHGAQIPGAFIGTSGVIGLVTAFIGGRKSQQDNSAPPSKNLGGGKKK